MKHDGHDRNDGSAWRRILAAHGIGLCLARRLVKVLGSPEAVVNASQASIRRATGLRTSQVDRIRTAITKVNLGREERWLESRNGGILEFGCNLYPTRLSQVPDPPPMMRYLGDPAVLLTPCIAIVGTRRCSASGLRQAGRFTQGLVENGCTVVSGGARGIDGEAHRAALRFGGRTVVVLGSGVGCPYPLEHEDMFERIIDSGGAVVSEVPVHQEPRPGLFPRRNRIISGLSMAVLVIEAPKRSGAMITARIAVEEHGNDAMVVPGPADSPTSSGCHHAVQEGWAHLVTSPGDVLRLLNEDFSSRAQLRS